MYVFLLVGVGLGGYGSALVGGDRENWGYVGIDGAAGSVGGGGLGAFNLCFCTVILGGFWIGYVSTP